MAFHVREMTSADVSGAVALQRLCFPDPFPEEFLWRPEHLLRHIGLFPQGQFVAVVEDEVVGSASNTRISLASYEHHLSWDQVAGGPFLGHFEPEGEVLYGLDISVHPDWRRQGVGHGLYEERYRLVKRLGMNKYATACRLPDFRSWSGGDESKLDEYLREVWTGDARDRVLSRLQRYDLRLVCGLHDYMADEDSLNCAALLEWLPQNDDNRE